MKGMVFSLRENSTSSFIGSHPSENFLFGRWSNKLHKRKLCQRNGIRIVSSTTPFWGPTEVDELYTTSTPKAWTLSWFLVWIELGIFQGTGVSNFFQWKSYNFFLRRAQHLLTWIFSFLTRCICFPKKWKTFFFVLLFVAIVVWEYGIFALLEV